MTFETEKLINELVVLMGKVAKHAQATQQEIFEVYPQNHRIREIGNKLNAAGGHAAMASAWAIVNSVFDDDDGFAAGRWVEFVWDGVGDWIA